MNANELADELENAKSISEVARLVKEQTIPMLRQLQDDLSDLQRHIPSKAKDRFPNYESICLQCGTTIYKPFKELTDEEIKFIAYPFESVYTTYDKQTDTDTVHTRFDQLGFARAILRKAQEK